MVKTMDELWQIEFASKMLEKCSFSLLGPGN